MNLFLIRKIFCFCLIALFFGATGAWARGIMLSPLRVNFENRDRYAKVTVINQDREKPVRFNISTVTLRMDDQGRMFEPQESSASETVARRMLRFSPSTAIISPGGKQVLRLMLKKPSNLPEGEYLTYLSAQPEDVVKEESVEKDSGGRVSLDLDIMVGVRIPVVIRHGELDVSVRASGLGFHRMKSGQLAADVVLEREGSRSCVLGIKLEQELPSGDVIKLGEKGRAVIYTPLKKRLVQVPLERADTLSKGGRLRIVLTDEEHDGAEVGRREFDIKK